MVSITVLVAPAIVLAQPPVDAPDWQDIGIWDALDSITNYLFWVLMIVAAIFIIIAGYNFVTAAGDPDKTKTARNFVLYALVGVLVGFLARGLVYFMQEVVTS